MITVQHARGPWVIGIASFNLNPIQTHHSELQASAELKRVILDCTSSLQVQPGTAVKYLHHIGWRGIKPTTFISLEQPQIICCYMSINGRNNLTAERCQQSKKQKRSQ